MNPRICVVNGGGRDFAALLRADPGCAVAATEIAGALEAEAVVFWNVPASIVLGLVRGCREAGRLAIVLFSEQLSEETSRAAVYAGAGVALRITDEATAVDFARILCAAIRASRFTRRRRSVRTSERRASP